VDTVASGVKRAPDPSSSGTRQASAIRVSRAAACSCRTCPWVKVRINEPSVDGAYTPVNSDGIPPCRAMFRSSMLSAPASIPATIVATLPAGFDPVGAENLVRAGQAACSYSWRMPARRSCGRIRRRVSVAGSVIGSGSGCSGRAFAMPR